MPRPSSNTSSHLQFLSAPRLSEQDAIDAVDQAYFSAMIKLRDIAQDGNTLQNEAMCAFGILEVACSHLRLTDTQLASRPPSDKSVTTALNLLVHLVGGKNLTIRQDVWRLLTADDLLAVLRRSHQCVPALLGVLKLISQLSSGATNHDEFAHEVKTEFVKSGVLAAFMDLISIHDGDKTEFEYPLTVVRSTCKIILMYGPDYLQHDPNAAIVYPRLHRALWIIGTSVSPVIQQTSVKLSRTLTSYASAPRASCRRETFSRS
jgi:hypothetical protein